MAFAPTKYAEVREGKERTVLDNFITAFEIIPADAEEQ
ncbi:MAG: type II toxin-antitoxin system VapC family toxin [Okeania sp. SIO2D1]|nr:type II toxin-antitoxin system VapC family toxin [Okeania sp. SIO2D1]